ncbi:MAG: DUF2436 domain-containing protein [Bacteroidales bacterium]
MKKSLFFIGMVLCFGIANSQVVSSRSNSVAEGQKQVVNPNHIPTIVKVSTPKDPIPAGHARIVLTAGDIWGDGTGYQLLIDADATAYGTIIPATGALTTSGDVDATVYAEFEYKIPTNADGALTTTNIVLSSSVTLDVPVGTIDWVVTNPTPGDRMWIAGGGRGDDLVLTDGFIYNFSLSLVGSGDNVSLNIVNPNLPDPTVTWDFQDGQMPNVFTIYNDQNTVEANVANFIDGWIAVTYDEGINYHAGATSWFTTVTPADRWMITPMMNLTAGNYLQFDVKSQDPSYLESMAVKISTTTKDKSAFTTTLWSEASVPGVFTTHTIDLSAYDGQDVFIAFILNSTDAFVGLVDNIKFLGQVSGINNIETNNYSIYPNPANDLFNISGAQGAKLNIYDAIGRVVLQDNVKSDNQSISISNLNPGVYTVQLINNGQVTSSKLIKK